MEYTYKLGFIGGGNMGKSIINGIIESKILDKNQMIISTLGEDSDILGIKTIYDNNYLLNNCEYIIFAVKPQIFNEIKVEIKEYKCKHIISIMAGVKVKSIQSVFEKCEIFRTMPNIATNVGEGMTAITNNIDSSESKNFVESVFNSIGKTVFIEETLFDTVTSISGSGPAYVYYFINSMIKSAVDNGLDYETAKKLVCQTFVGATKMVQKSNHPIDTLIDNVCSKGGTTIQAIDYYKESELDKIIMSSIDKCRVRSEELSK